MTTFLIRNSTRSLPLLGHILSGIVQLAALGTVGGTLFGVLFGVFATLLPGLPWTIAGLAGYFAISGGCAGFAVGLLGTWIEGKPETSDVVLAETMVASRYRQRQRSARPADAGTPRQPQNRVAALLNVKTHRTPSVVLRDPSRN